MKFELCTNKQRGKKFKYPDNLKRIEEKVLYRLQSLKQELEISNFPTNILKSKSHKIEKSQNMKNHILTNIQKDTIDSNIDKSTLIHNNLKEDSKIKSFLNNSNSDTLHGRKSSISMLKDNKIKEFEQSLKKHAKAELEEQRKIRRKVIKILRDYSQCKRYFKKTENFNEKIVNQYENLCNEISNEENLKNPHNCVRIKNPKSIVTDLGKLFSEKPPIEVVLTQNLDKQELSLLKIDSKFYKKTNKNIFDNNNEIFTNSSLLSKIENEDEENIRIKFLLNSEKNHKNNFSKVEVSPIKQIDRISTEINNQAYKNTFKKNLIKNNTSELISTLNNSRIFEGNRSSVNTHLKYGKNLEDDHLRENSLECNKLRILKVLEFGRDKNSRKVVNDKEMVDVMNNIFMIKENFIQQNKNFQNYKKLWRLERDRINTTES